MYSMVCAREDFAHVVGVFEQIYIKTREETFGHYKEGLQIFVALQILQSAIKEDLG
jgi:hypothetical protein